LYLAFASSVQARLTESACEGCISHTHMHTRTTHARTRRAFARTHTHAHAEHLHAGDGVPRKDRCLVNVVRYMPADVADFCHTRSQLGLPHAGG